METGTVWRWKPRNGTGVIKLDDVDSTLVWFHLSDARGDLDIATIAEGLPVDVEVEPIPQGEFKCRAKSVHRRN
ncbi:hypothetical protein OHB12_27770 [Nocardia sp. NBC_01730]|uniref:hypothetical protein n=1 Tax=Nocardia sp. NBC_01730 TaxID=2975998 RepID=UPI002E0F6EFC|nr:hypothetical protein OHB12_27770 [Nocardia sp. NBC_01730]